MKFLKWLLGLDSPRHGYHGPYKVVRHWMDLEEEIEIGVCRDFCEAQKLIWKDCEGLGEGSLAFEYVIGNFCYFSFKPHIVYVVVPLVEAATF